MLEAKQGTPLFEQLLNWNVAVSCWQMSFLVCLKFFIRLDLYTALHFEFNVTHSWHSVAFKPCLKHEFRVSQGSVETVFRWNGKHIVVANLFRILYFKF